MSRRPPPRLDSRMGSKGSFRAGSPLPTLPRGPSRSILRRISTQYHYQTFPTPPPRSSGRRRAGSGTESPGSYSERRGGNDEEDNDDGDRDGEASPLPWRQLALLAVLSLAEQTALNSISPYLPEMIESFPGVEPDQVGLYVGLLASAFALAQLLTNLVWGYLSDIIGRKPVLLTGTTLLCLCFTAFGFCSKYWHVMLVHIAMGLLNGNAAVVPTCLGELTDRTNQSRAFIWLPVVYSLGSITGPALGGLLVGTVAPERFPYLAPNILSAGLLAVSVVVLVLGFEETLDEQGEGYEAPEVLEWLRTWLDRSKKNKGEHDEDDYDEDERRQDSEDSALLGPNAADEGVSNNDDDSDNGSDDDRKLPTDPETWKEIFNRTTVVLLLTFLIFQLSNSSFNSLYPIFASGDPPTGRGLKAGVIGVTLSVAGLFTILFQLFVFGPLKARLGNVGTYRGSLLGFAISMALMPFIGYKDSEPPFGFGSSSYWLYVEAGFILVVKNICAVGGLSSAMLLVTNSAPSHASLGTLNGIAQTLSAAGRSVGPFLSGALFTLSTRLDMKGEALAWGLFAGISLAGWVGTFAIHGAGLESTDDGFEDSDGENGEGDEERGTGRT
ncbi:major facilitator superfamily domain-containing protein [Microdochium trichocladiopsis]|uniref:Major facilitator superfamily domain-containing protein n=1 Tax=Microdochium trichocladiopsis TaxID=1682393 RepID=A0A9P8YD91_9PEZI|nr:major facilitator superfamily domain-containing protein [Microdochium trichocladiopsis]KAH7037203.1 major facilitator superfamily domain-containing protein [Microdochium trichocladiopsis]